MNKLLSEFLSTFIAGFIFLIVFFSNPGFAVPLLAQETASNYSVQALFASDSPSSSPDFDSSLPSPTHALFASDSPASPPSSGTSTAPSTSPNPSNPNSSSSGSLTGASSNPSSPGAASAPATSSSENCAVSRLSPIEAKQIMNLTHEGFNGKKITDGADANSTSPVKKIDETNLIGKDLGGQDAVKVTAPSSAALADRFSSFNGTRINGPFGIGLILDDTLRVGRCNDLPQTQCKIFGAGLTVRTSGIGFKSDFKNIFASMKETTDKTTAAVSTAIASIKPGDKSIKPDDKSIKPDDKSIKPDDKSIKPDDKSIKPDDKSSQSIAQANLSQTELDKLKQNYLDLSSSQDFMTGTFGTGDMIKNSILVDSYAARNATTCNNSACVISTYSAFNKYFNAWLSTDMVVSNIGPTLLHSANKFLTSTLRRANADPLNSRLAKLMKVREFFTGIPANVSRRLIAGEPSKIVGQARTARFKALIHEEGFAEVFDPLVIKRNLWSSGGGGEIDKLTSMNSPIWKYSPEKRQKFFEAVEHLRAYARANATAVAYANTEYNEALKLANAIADPAAKRAAIRAAKLDYGQKMALYLDDWDEILSLDFEAWAKTNEDLFSLGGIAVKKGGDYPADQGYVDLSTAHAFNLKRIVQKFRDKGDWSDWAGTKNAGEFETAPIRDAAGNITGYSNAVQLFRLEPNEIIAENVGLPDLKFHTARLGKGTYSVKLPDGRFLPLNADTVDYIASMPTLPGNVNIYKSSYKAVEPMTPEDFANRLSDPRLASRPKTAARNMDDLHNSLVTQDYAGRKFYSVLDQQYANEGDMIKSYYKNPAMGIYKGAVLPVLYWNAKKGFGQQDYSAYMLPDTWTTLTITQGVDKIYKDSFIDFFVNEGSDQGDMFQRAFKNILFVWNRTIEMAASTNQFVEQRLSRVSGGFLGDAKMRDKVGEVAFYSHNENCAGCTGQLNYENNYLILNGFRSESNNMQAFLLEATDEATKKKSGTTLISYTHHSDITGKTSSSDGTQVTLTEAQRTGTTCDQKLKKLGLGGFFSWAGTSTGLYLGLAENAAYFFGFGPGLIGSFFQQMYFGRELQDCIDDKEGYYIHFYAPPQLDQTKSKSKEALSNETVTTAISDMSTKLDSFVKEKLPAQSAEKPSAATNPVEKSIDKLKEQFTQFSQNAKKANILQASVDLMAPAQGTVSGKDIFYIWFKDTLMPSEYRTTGKTVTVDGNISVEKDFEKGTLSINGKQVLGPDKADHVRMIAQDNRIPAEVVPMTLNKVAAPMDDSIVFELNTSGQIHVKNMQVLQCIQKAVFDQTGIKFNQDELTQVFGDLKGISTTAYGSVFARSGKIFLEGSGPRMEGTQTSQFIINGFWETKLMLDANGLDTGKFKGMTFEYGSIVLKPETNELVIWLRHHKESILSTSDVKSLLAKPTTVVDPETECVQPALDLEAVPHENDELGAKKVDNFNTSMKHLGPFTQFTTDKKIYEFYSKRDPATNECKNYFRVRDKDTGKILTDSEIVGGIKVGNDGSIQFTTADGKDHSLKFDAENGVPKISYNNGPPETLLTAQGPNGSFWFDPEKGLWYPENGLMIPLNQAFKDNGSWFAPDKNGNVTGTPENKMTFNLGEKASGSFNIPSMPQTVPGILVFTLAFLALAFILTQRKRKSK
jgi:hypothetical protein